jgi:hypothetical protein
MAIASPRSSISGTTTREMDDNQEGTPPRRASRTFSESGSNSPHIRRIGTESSRATEQRLYAEHLRKWALNHDSSVHFHGGICPVRPTAEEDRMDLYRSVLCVLYHGEEEECSAIVIRLFPPRPNTDGCYKMVIRSGAGWMPSRDYFEKEYFKRLHQLMRDPPDPRYGNRKNTRPKHCKLVEKCAEMDFVKVRPLFKFFSQLPGELQSLILAFAVHKQPIFEPGALGGFRTDLTNWIRRHPRGGFLCELFFKAQLRLTFSGTPPSKIRDIFLISKTLNTSLVPWFYRSTDFYFETSGMTNFLWCAGPIHRSYIQKITVNFGTYSLLHCLRWLAPDPVFDLFDPPMYGGLQYLWRIQRI